MTKKRGLGRGLSALLESPGTDITSNATGPDRNLRTAGSIANIPLDSIEENPFQPRATFDKTALLELSTSIQELGLIQPITVRKLGNDRYQLISGERRFRASKLAGIKELPAYIRVANDQAMLEMALVENIQRQELDAIEIAISYQRLLEECNLTQERLSERVGKDRSSISNYIRLLKLPAEIQMAIREGRLSMGHARALVSLDDPKKQLETFNKIVSSQLSVRQVEEIARSENRSSKGGNEKLNLSLEDQELRDALAEKLGTEIALRVGRKGKGKLEINFRNREELARVRSLLGI